VLLLGLEASEASLAQAFRAAAGQRWCKGFAVGRSLFAHAADGWFSGALADDAVIADVAQRYQRLIRLWCEAIATPPAAETAAFMRTTT
jgi:5-dehydro-2-deoxygluconokinase